MHVKTGLRFQDRNTECPRAQNVAFRAHVVVSVDYTDLFPIPGKALPTCSYTKNSLLTALVNCKARMVSCQYDSFLCLQLASRHDN